MGSELKVPGSSTSRSRTVRRQGKRKIFTEGRVVKGLGTRLVEKVCNKDMVLEDLNFDDLTETEKEVSEMKDPKGTTNI